MNMEAPLGQPPEKRLGFFSRALLSVAALSKGIAGIVKEDSRKSRAAFWAYAGVIGVIAPVCIGLTVVPGPNIFGVGLAAGSAFLFAGGVKGLAALGISSWARRHNEKHLRDIFNGKALMKRYDAYILPRTNKPDAYYINKRALLADTFNRVGDDMHEASPGPLRRAFSLARANIVNPVMEGLSALYSRVAGNAPEAGKAPEQEPPSTRAPGPPQP